MRWLAFWYAFAAAVSPAAAEPPPPPAYAALRFNEDYRYLADSARRSDVFDAWKFLPLRAGDPGWFLTIGGEIRQRLEVFEQPDFGLGGASHDSYLLQRLSLHFDLHLGDRLRVFVQGISGTVWGEDRPAPAAQDDPLDLQFAFVDLVAASSANDRLTFRLGRYGLGLGSSRLVATRSAPNIPYKFDGLELLYRSAGWELAGFVNRPVRERTDGFDRPNPRSVFWGLYATLWTSADRKSGFDFYYLGLRQRGAVFASGRETQTRHSLGVRSFGAAGGWDWDAEAVGQCGTFGRDEIRAWTASLDFGHTWRTATWQPRLGLKVDVASGDRDPGDGRLGTFDPLFFKSAYFNEASLLRPSNLVDLHPTWTFRPHPDVTVVAGVNFFWRFSGRDAAYDPPGFIQVPVTANRRRFLGTALDLNVGWKVQRHLVISAAYVRFVVDDYIRSAGGRDTGFFTTTASFQF